MRLYEQLKDYTVSGWVVAALSVLLVIPKIFNIGTRVQQDVVVIVVCATIGLYIIILDKIGTGFPEQSSKMFLSAGKIILVTAIMKTVILYFEINGLFRYIVTGF